MAKKKMSDEKVIKAYKGFDENLCCRGFQYEVGKEYEMDGEVECCKRGFHACESPLEVLDYYFLFDDCKMARFCEVEQSGKTHTENNVSTKVASSKIKIKAELKFTELLKLGIEWLKEKTSPVNVTDEVIGDNGENEKKIGSRGNYAQIGSSGDYAQIGSSGDSAKICSSGDYALIGSSGDYALIGSSGDYAKIGSSGFSAQIGSSGNYAQIGSSGDSAKIGSSGFSAQIKSTGQDSVICCVGINCIASAKKGSWITLAEWVYDKDKRRNVPKCVKTEQVDGVRIKEDTPYKLVDGEFKEV
jgi:hypothetical protein